MGPTAQVTGQSVPNSPSQQTGGGGFWGGLNNTLSNAFGIYMTYEGMRQQASGNGQTLANKPYQNELPNGSQYLYDEQKSLSVPMQSDSVYIGGMAVPKVIAYGGGALIALALVYKMVKG
jgi:hypothetical protein